MNIRALSDLHGRLPYVEPCDALLIAGDICPITGDHSLQEQARFLNGPFKTWCEAIPTNQIVLIPGNHDFIFEQKAKGYHRELAARVTLLVDQGIDLANDGPRVWGSPWVPNLPRWAFCGSQMKLREKADAIPPGYDIWLQHGPPHPGSNREYALDLVRREHVGNRPMVEAINQKQPPLVICGHIHERVGTATFGETLVTNIAFVDNHYDAAWVQLEIDWDADTRKIITSEITPMNSERGLACDCIRERWK
ncbi:MAG: metallophosphoesterase family protein [Solirubrobacterales bacterium]